MSIHLHLDTLSPEQQEIWTAFSQADMSGFMLYGGTASLVASLQTAPEKMSLAYINVSKDTSDKATIDRCVCEPRFDSMDYLVYLILGLLFLLALGCKIYFSL